MPSLHALALFRRRHLARWIWPWAASLTAIFLFGIGCTSPPRRNVTRPEAERPLTPQSWVRTELYFGGIAPEPWTQFLAEVVTPRFPAGLTVADATGQWRGRDGTIHQLPTRVLIILHPGTPETHRSLEEIRTLFRDRFHHESVLRSDTPAQVTF